MFHMDDSHPVAQPLQDVHANFTDDLSAVDSAVRLSGQCPYPFTQDFLAHLFSSDERLADSICFPVDIERCVARSVLGDLFECFGPRLLLFLSLQRLKKPASSRGWVLCGLLLARQLRGG